MTKPRTAAEVATAIHRLTYTRPHPDVRTLLDEWAAEIRAGAARFLRSRAEDYRSSTHCESMHGAMQDEAIADELERCADHIAPPQGTGDE